MKEMKRILALVLCMVMLVGIMPASAFATETGDAQTDITAPAVETTPVETTEASEETEGETTGSTEETEEETTESSGETEEETTEVTEETTEETEEETTETTESDVIAVTGITLDQTELEVGVGAEPVTLVATVLPEDATDKTVTWTSSEPGVASVEDGIVTFGYMGEAVITATAGEFSATCTVTVGEGEAVAYSDDTVDYLFVATDRHTNTSIIATMINAMESKIGENELDYLALGGDMVGSGGSHPTYTSSTVLSEVTGATTSLNQNNVDIVAGMREMGLLVSVNSNGSMLKGKILERFLEAPPVRFNISLYGGSNETYRNMCGLPAYDQVKENIRALRKAGVDVSLNLSITPYNKEDLAQIYGDAVELDVNVRASSYMYPSVRVNGEQYGCGNRLSCAESARYAVEWDKLRFTEEEFALRAENMEKMILEEQDGCPLEEGEGVRCRAGSSSFWMTWDGRMLPCGMMTTPVAEPLKIGFDAAWEQIRSATAQIRLPAKCVSCDYRDICGSCAAVCYTETGRFDGVPEYVCQRAEEIVKATVEANGERKRK